MVLAAEAAVPLFRGYRRGERPAPKLANALVRAQQLHARVQPPRRVDGEHKVTLIQRQIVALQLCRSTRQRGYRLYRWPHDRVRATARRPTANMTTRQHASLVHGILWLPLVCRALRHSWLVY